MTRSRPSARAGSVTIAVVALLWSALSCDVFAPRTPFGRDAALVERVFAAEDGRATSTTDLAPVFAGLASSNAEVRRLAVRALGRLERAELVDSIIPRLDDEAMLVRAEAANALAQAVLNGEPAAARAAIEARLDAEADAYVLGVMAESLGRMVHASTEAAVATAARLVRLPERAPGATAGHSPASDPLPAYATSAGSGVARELGTARGLFFLARQQVARNALPDAAMAWLRMALRPRPEDNDTLHTRRLRGVAAAALVASGRAAGEDLATILDDEHPLVRREAAAALGTARPAEWERLVTRALADASPMVRYDALRALARNRGPDSCPRLLEAVQDPGPHVRLLAIDLTGQHCTAPQAAAILEELAWGIVDENGAEMRAWHAPAHALFALATLDAERARSLLPAFVRHSSLFPRMWAARAAAAVGERDRLIALAADEHPNVRTEALGGLVRLLGRDADAAVTAQLSQSDSQLLQTAARALEGSSHAPALPALLDALDRVTAAGYETLRDARLALLERIAELGGYAHSGRLRPLLSDPDPVVAGRTADVLGAWTGTRPEPTPLAVTRIPSPPLRELERLAAVHVVIEMEAGDTIELRLRPFDAPTNAARFARLAEAGYFDGLTFHRIAPNFVVQGGSPNANEYAGDGPYTRDELVGEANWRGTVGLSTRGRDTGDAQLYVNLIDNVRLDHNYTVFATVVRGMDVVDGLLEGATIRGITLR